MQLGKEIPVVDDKVNLEPEPEPGQFRRIDPNDLSGYDDLFFKATSLDSSTKATSFDTIRQPPHRSDLELLVVLQQNITAIKKHVELFEETLQELSQRKGAVGQPA